MLLSPNICLYLSLFLDLAISPAGQKHMIAYGGGGGAIVPHLLRHHQCPTPLELELESHLDQLLQTRLQLSTPPLTATAISISTSWMACIKGTTTRYWPNSPFRKTTTTPGNMSSIGVNIKGQNYSKYSVMPHGVNNC